MGHTEPPGYRKKVERGKPTIGLFLPIIHAILEDDKKKHPKQRHTGKRVFDRLREEHGYTGGITVVRDAIRRYQQSAAEVFMPLAHPPGEAQFDFGQAQAVYRGREIKVMFCVMSLPQSDAFFCQAFPRECTETLQEGHVRAFSAALSLRRLQPPIAASAAAFPGDDCFGCGIAGRASTAEA